MLVNVGIEIEKRMTMGELTQRVNALPPGPDKTLALAAICFKLAVKARANLLLMAEPVVECKCLECKSISNVEH
jgi:hypothetical protein